MDDVPSWEATAGGHHRVSRCATPYRSALFEDRRTPRPVNCAVNSAAAEQRIVGGIDNGIDSNGRDVAPHHSDLHATEPMHTLPAVRVRFDDLRPGREASFRFVGTVASETAHALEDVTDLLAEAESHAIEGRWVALGLAYEAAPALQPGHVTHESKGVVPLAWYGAFEAIEHSPPWGATQPFRVEPWVPSVTEAEHGRAVEAIRSLIAAGDTYQVNYTLRLISHAEGDLATLYRRLVEAQSGGWGAFVETDDWAVLSASPELFIRWDQDGTLTTRPMKGTRRRGRTPAEDVELRTELATSKKDRAENLMIVDLLRNDLGQICEFGSVGVSRLFDVERYRSVWQLTSEVTGRARDGLSLVEVLGALFPCGSVTGAPKRRTMEIIRSLEADPRGIYCGALGYLSPEPTGPRAQFNVAIRTIEIDRRTGEAAFGTGGGVTWDSSAQREWQEVLDKARVLEVSAVPLVMIETMRWEPTQGAVRASLHLDRLAASAEHFGVPFDREQAEARLALIDADRALRLRLTVAVGGVMEVELGPAPAEPARPVRLAIDDVPVNRLDPFLFHKTNRRDAYESAVARYPHADEVVLVNELGNVTDTNRSNLAVRIDGAWCTPPIAEGLLPGVMRAELLAAGELTERAITVAEFQNAPEVAVINSLRGWRRAELMAPTSTTSGDH